jgi:adenylate cyclase
MSPEKFKRKLAAILSADVKGYSRLMGENEEETIRTLNAYKQAMTDFIQKHRGRVVGTAGDSMLAEFASVVDAVRCAVEIQEEIKERNKELAEDHRMEFRIGINLGDVVEEGDTIYGDGVNIAARVESLAEAGGISVSGTVYDQVGNKLALGYEFLGEQMVKNIKEPVRVYRVRMEPEVASAKLVEERKPARKGLSRAVMAIIAIVVIAGGAILYQFILLPSPPKVEVASKEKMAFPLPEVPSIAVLPFVNMSGDPKQEFLCEGITGEIITTLSRVPGLVVIARTSTFTYKGKPVKVKQVSEELGVRYVLEGGVQRSADRIRINAQLIDAITGSQIWAERYERNLKDIFALQDEINLKILTAIRVKLTAGEQALKVEKYFKGKQGLDCYLKYLEVAKYGQRATLEDTDVARRLSEQFIAMCPESPMAYLWRGYVHLTEYWMGSGKSPQESIEKGIEMAQKALAMDDSIAGAHTLLGNLYAIKTQYDRAIAEGERAVILSPGSSMAYEFYAQSLNYAGRSEEAIPLLQKAIRLNPFSPAYTFVFLGHSFRMTGRFEEAVSAFKEAIKRGHNISAHIGLTGTYSMMGREKEARAQAAEVLRINPKFSLDSYAKILPYKDQSEKDNYINALRKAGLK